MSSIREIWADEIVTPTSRGAFRRLRNAKITFSPKGQILEVASAGASRLRIQKRVNRLKVVTPGFVDAHTHLIFSGNRADEWGERLSGVSYEEIRKRGGGIQKTVSATRAASSSDLLKLGLHRAKTSISFGITTQEVKSGYGLDLDTELKILRVIRTLQEQTKLQMLSTFMGAHLKPTEFESSRAYIDYLIQKVLPEVRGLAVFQDVFCERGYFTEEESVRLLKAGRRLGLKPKVHAHEFGRTGGVRAAVRAKALSADHLMVMNKADIQSLKRAGVVAVILPGTSFFLGGKVFAPARAMWDAGVKVAIGSDFNPGTNPTQNFALMGSISAIFQKLNLEEILTAQTWHGALALGLKDRGCLEPGMRADFVAWDHEHFEEIYYSYGCSRVAEVYLGGEKVFMVG